MHNLSSIPRTGRAKGSYITRFFRTRFVLVLFSLLLLIGILLSLMFVLSHHEDEHNYIVNILGLQRMLSQQMTKDANRIASIYEALGSDERVQSEDTLRSKLDQIRPGLLKSAAQFESTFSQVRTGRIDYGDAKIELFEDSDLSAKETIAGIEACWAAFRPAVELIAGSESSTTEFRKALIFVNENNETLLALSDRLNTLAIQHFGAESGRAQFSLTLLIITLVLVCIWILIGTYRLIIEPYTIFYLGLKSLGSRSEGKMMAPPKRQTPLVKEVNETFAVLRDMVNLIGVISQGTSFNDTLHLIFRTFKSHIPYNYIGVATFVGYQGNQLAASFGEGDGSFPGLPSRLFDQIVDFSDTSLKNLVSVDQPRVINDLEAYAETHLVRDYTRIILEEGVRSSITLPLTVNGKALGFLFFSSKERNVYTDMHVDFLRNIRNAVALSFEKDIFVDELVYSSTLALAKMAEARDEDTADHLDRMRRYSVLLAKVMLEDGVYGSTITPEFLHVLERFSPMHDIGKVGIRDNVLLKPGKLDDTEMAHMRTHALYGANVLREAETNIARSGRTLFQAGIRIAASHHERWDGKGYPSGLSGDTIPLEARIVSVADVFDALTTRRPYKAPFEFERSYSMIVEGRGTQFDPSIVDVFRRHQDDFRSLYDEFRIASPESY